MFSFHATKLCHSLEGGMLIFPNPSLKTEVDYLKNFGFKNEVEVVMPGTNAKMNEMQALMGLTMLKYASQLIGKRRAITKLYREQLQSVPGIYLPPLPSDEIDYNYAYFPVEIDEREFGISRDQLHEKLKEYNILTRRYFYPLICDFACYSNVPVADSLKTIRGVAERILMMPIYYDLALDDVQKICDITITLKG
jgi:dTDP-4-amino-4,6-dideoxygalactose transaminase